MYIHIYIYRHILRSQTVSNRAWEMFDMHVGRGPRLVTTGHKFVQLTTIQSFKRLLHH